MDKNIESKEARQRRALEAAKRRAETELRREKRAALELKRAKEQSAKILAAEMERAERSRRLLELRNRCALKENLLNILHDAIASADREQIRHTLMRVEVCWLQVGYAGSTNTELSRTFSAARHEAMLILGLREPFRAPSTQTGWRRLFS